MNTPNNAQPQPSGQISIQDIFGIYAMLNGITDPSANIKKAKENIETIILAFTQSLGHLGAKQ